MSFASTEGPLAWTNFKVATFCENNVQLEKKEAITRVPLAFFFGLLSVSSLILFPFLFHCCI
jgi:hypothetical protein